MSDPIGNSRRYPIIWFILTISWLYNWYMSSKSTRSLKEIIFRHEVAILFLVMVTGLIGGLSAYFWQRNSIESVRINAMFYFTEQIRGELYAQIQEMIRARVLEDPHALDVYPKYSRSISERFNELRRRSSSREEDIAIQELNLSYRKIQRDMNNIFNDPYIANKLARVQLLNPQFAQRMVGNFENRYTGFKEILSGQHKQLERTVALWARFAPFIISVPLIIVLLIVLYTRHVMRVAFIKPIANIMQGAGRISRGKLEHHIEEKGVQEVSELASAINKMAVELVNSRESLLENERQAALGSLVPVVAHNIRNPLASIRATAQLLEQTESRDEINELKQAIIETIDRLGRWVNSLVSYLHPLKPDLKDSVPEPLVDAALGLLANRIAEKKINIIKQNWGIGPLLSVDPDLMEQAFYALFANAIDASPASGVIRITLTAPEDYIEIRILDNGPGLPFEPKPRGLEPGPSTKRFGTGLGIQIAYKICQAHGWNLTFNVIKDVGTEVVIAAPLHRIKTGTNDAG